MKALKIILLALIFIAFQAHADDDRNLAVKQVNNAVSEQRIALVIGNGAYTSSPLKNPVNDAKDMAKKLRGLGFIVIERSNLQTKQIGATLREFRSKLVPGAVALVFYAGHGLQIKGDNYLPAVDADINSEEDVPNQSLAVKQIMDVLDESKTRLNLVFLDACRNNPYARSFRSADKGLARVSAPSGTLISYATRPGSVAADGGGRNGLYTSKLLAQMNSTVQIEQALKRVVTEVKAASQGKQEPWMEGSIEGDFCFAGCAASGGAQVANLESAPSPVGGSVLLDDIKKQQAVRARWDKWQAGMKTDFDKIVALNAAPELQVTAWERFLSNYAQDNPFSAEDEELRVQAQSNKQNSEERMRQQKADAEMKPGKVFRDCPDCPEMVVIPAGSFKMGSNNGEADEKPIHRVTIAKPFAMGKTEVTQGQWKAIMGNNPSHFGNCGDTCPVESVSWSDAQAFIRKLNAKTGKQYRLPTEAEWEYACRAGGRHEYCGSDNINAVAWYYNNSDKVTNPVATKQANAFGLYDMSGNVWEWVEDSYHKNYNGAPTNGSAWQGNGAKGVLRGGAGYDVSQGARAATRGWNEPADRVISFGFRLAKMLP